MLNNFRDKSIISKRESLISKHISREECQRRILEAFPILNDEKSFHNYFCSYDFHYHEKYILEFWREIIFFLFESVYESFALNINEILDKTKLKDRRPVGLPNIILELINKGEYILSSQLNEEDYFRKNHPNLFKADSWGTWIKKGVIATVKYPIGFLSNDKKSDLIKEFKSDELLINKRFFHNHLEGILNLLSRISMEEDIEVLTKNELRNILQDPNIKYQDAYFDLSLNYMNKIKKIEIFKVKIENAEMECIKLLHDEGSQVTEKDKAIINILIQIKKIDRRLEETMEVVQDCLQNAKNHLKNKNKQAASICMKKKILYLNTYNHYSNLKITLEHNLIDIKSMQSNQSVKNILENVVKTSQQINLNLDEFNDVADRLKEQKDNLKEAKDLLVEYNNDDLNDESIDAELQLMTEHLKIDDKKQITEKYVSQVERNETIILDELVQPNRKVIFDHNSNSLLRNLPEINYSKVQANNDIEDDEEFNKMLEELNK